MQFITGLVVFLFYLFAFIICRFTKARRIKNAKRDRQMQPLPPGLENETQIRKQWLRSFYLMTAFWIIRIWLSWYSSYEVISADFAEVFEKLGIGMTLLLGVFFSIVAVIPSIWVTYHCAYKKSGTAWLMWLLITMPIAEVVALLTVEKWTLMVAVTIIVSIAAEIYFLVSSLRLYRVNVVKEHNRVVASKETAT